MRELIHHLAGSLSAISVQAKYFFPAGAAAFSAFTFWLGYRQKEKERVLSYYHKIVVDEAIPLIINFFVAARQRLDSNASRLLDTPKDPDGDLIPRETAEFINEFMSDLFSLQDKIVERLSIFDEKATRRVQRHFEDIEDQVTGWYNSALLSRRAQKEKLLQGVEEGQRRIIEDIYRGQFRSIRLWSRTRRICGSAWRESCEFIAKRARS